MAEINAIDVVNTAIELEQSPDMREFKELGDAWFALHSWRLSPQLTEKVLALEKQARCQFKCKKCGASQIQFGTINDARAVTSSLTELLNQSFGRPTEQKRETEIIVNRHVYLIAAEDEIPAEIQDQQVVSDVSEPEGD